MGHRKQYEGAGYVEEVKHGSGHHEVVEVPLVWHPRKGVNAETVSDQSNQEYGQLNAGKRVTVG